MSDMPLSKRQIIDRALAPLTFAEVAEKCPTLEELVIELHKLTGEVISVRTLQRWHREAA